MRFSYMSNINQSSVRANSYRFMRGLALSLCLTALLCAITLNDASAQATAPSNTSTTVVQNAQTLTALVSSKATPTDPSIARFDFGTAYVSSNSIIHHTFYLRNDFHRSLSISHLAPSCGCTSALIAGSLPVILAPGRQVAVDVSVDLARVEMGQIGKYVGVYLVNQAQPIAFLAITGNVENTISVIPETLNFGNVSIQGRRSILFSVHLDPKHTPRDMQIKLVSVTSRVLNLSDLTLIEAPIVKSSASESIISDSNTGQPTSRTFLIKLTPHNRAGTFDGSILISLGPGRRSPKDDNTADLSIKIPICGKILSPISASPSVVEFGKVNNGQESKQNVLVHGLTKQDLLTAHLITLPYFSARWAPSTLTSSNSDTTDVVSSLEISLSSTAPIGELESQVSIVTKSGMTFVLPTTAEVIADPKKSATADGSSSQHIVQSMSSATSSKLPH